MSRDEHMVRADRLTAGLVGNDVIHPDDHRREQRKRHPQGKQRVQVPVGARLRPPLRRDAVRRLLADDLSRDAHGRVAEEQKRTAEIGGVCALLRGRDRVAEADVAGPEQRAEKDLVHRKLRLGACQRR